MPEMDGIETTRRLRESGYTGAVVALTANALVGNAEMFKANGFDDFVPKPIDVRRLDVVLNTYVREKYPEEAAKYDDVSIDGEEVLPPKPSVSPKLLEIFRRDAQKAISVLRETTESENMKLFTTTVHAMKSALANVCEKELSDRAFELEKAGQRCDNEFINANIVRFIESLQVLITKYAPVEESELNTDEDTALLPLLKEQLALIKAACEDYDDDTAIALLDSLKAGEWSRATLAALEEIRDALFLHSDFDGAAEKIEALM
jgi:CheY-like chemotaxis protein